MHINNKKYVFKDNNIEYNESFIDKIEIQCNYQYPIDYISLEEFKNKSNLNDVEIIVNLYKDMVKNLRSVNYGLGTLRQSNLKFIKLKIKDNDIKYLLAYFKQHVMKVFVFSDLTYITFSAYGHLIGNNDKY